MREVTFDIVFRFLILLFRKRKSKNVIMKLLDNDILFNHIIFIIIKKKGMK